MKCILVILDGLGDRGHAVFKGQTPLEVAQTPNLDRLAALGMNGLYHSWLQGVAMPSEIAHFLMFGYDLHEFPGRGYIEARGDNIRLQNNEVALLARIFSVKEMDKMLVLEVENPELDQKSCLELQNEIRNFSQDGVEIEFIPTKGIRGLVLIRGEISAALTDSNPIYEGRPLMEVVPWESNQHDESAGRTARILNSYLTWCYQRLSHHPINKRRKEAGQAPINAVGTQRPGQMKSVQSFGEKWGLRALAISSGALYQGLSRHLGMATQMVKDTGSPGADLLERLKLAKAAADFDFIFVHTKATDEASHTKDPQIKKSVIESIDRAFAYALDEIITDQDILLVITADHSTNSAGEMIHSGETVPLTMLGKYTRRDDVQQFNEISCAHGALALVRGKELMYLILNFLDRGKLFGLMDSPIDQPYFPGKYKPLKIK
ncbi:MAG: alkaline phosphatase family protein [Desulfobacca sp.]|nr:alkaline phosphatase family protein [Desulfobacca sp.]